MSSTINTRLIRRIILAILSVSLFFLLGDKIFDMDLPDTLETILAVFSMISLPALVYTIYRREKT